jgi:hypothetical protein
MNQGTNPLNTLLAGFAGFTDDNGYEHLAFKTALPRKRN